MNEWDALPWWQARIYLDGLSEEFSEGDATTSRGFTGDDLADLASLGFNVQKAG